MHIFAGCKNVLFLCNLNNRIFFRNKGSFLNRKKAVPLQSILERRPFLCLFPFRRKIFYKVNI